MPGDREPVFLESYYAALRWGDVISSDDSVRLPTISGPDLVLRVSVCPGTNRADLGVGLPDRRLAAAHAAARRGAPEDDYRDLARRAALLAGLDLPLRRYRPAGATFPRPARDSRPWPRAPG